MQTMRFDKKTAEEDEESLLSVWDVTMRPRRCETQTVPRRRLRTFMWSVFSLRVLHIYSVKVQRSLQLVTSALLETAGHKVRCPTPRGVCVSHAGGKLR